MWLFTSWRTNVPFTFPRITDVRKGETFVSPRAYYLTEDNKVVTQDNLPKGRVSLLVAEGAQIGYEDAEKHGLLETLKEASGALKLEETVVAENAATSEKTSKESKVADALPKVTDAKK